jgi:hypothetical protein
VPYLYPDLDEDTSKEDESAAIEAGAINATGFRYVGTVAWEDGLIRVLDYRLLGRRVNKGRHHLMGMPQSSSSEVAAVNYMHDPET